MTDEEHQKFLKEVEQSKLKHFNWGACGFTWLWALFNGAFKKMGIITVFILLFWVFKFFVPKPLIIICNLISICLSIFCGICGNEWAYYGNRKWENVDSFNETQQKWALAFAIVLIIMFILGFFAKI